MKRSFDFLAALLLIFALSPVFFLVSLCLLIFQGRPVLFIQQRLGKDCKIFHIIKFRTMNEEKEETSISEDSTSRVTKIGNFLRRYSIDELPELFNVVKGEMSLVGPRPLLVEYALYYSEFQNIRHNVLPGITGLAQIKGRNKITWEKKFKYDVFYVRNISFCFDLKILFTTFTILFLNEINENEQVTVSRFGAQKGKKQNDG